MFDQGTRIKELRLGAMDKKIALKETYSMQRIMRNLPLLLVFFFASFANAITITENGQAKAVIVVGPGASEPVKHAAQELADFVRRISEAKLDVVVLKQQATDGTTARSAQELAQYAGMSWLYVGPAAAKLVDPKFSTKDLGQEGIVIRTVQDDLILAGPEPRGTLYAVYTFLEDTLGCRWWDSKVSTIPKQSTTRFGKLDVRYVPPVEFRESFWYDAFDGNWAVRNKCNGHTHRLSKKQGGKHIYHGFVHTFYSLIPPATYFKEHPEWFSEINGKRKHDRTQLCLTNEEMRRELIKNLKERLRANPTATIASVSQNDWHGNCQCYQCKAVDEREGSPAGSLLHFVNAVAEAIEEEFPHVAISTLAYQYTRKPPKYVKPRKNVIVRLCSIECSFSKPLADERNQKFRDDIVAWSKICNRLYIWDYTTNFRHHIMPHPNLKVLGPNVKFFVDHNVKGIFEQGAYTTNGAEMAELRAWVLAKMLWNPKQDSEKLIDEFIEGYYGAAAKHIQDYLKVTHDAVETSGDHLGCFSAHTAKFLSFNTLRRSWQHLQEAEEAVKDDPDLLFRVQCAQLPVLYTFMVRWNEYRKEALKTGAPWPLSNSIAEVYKLFKSVAEKKNITRLNEHKAGFESLAQHVKRVANRNAPGS